MPRQNYSVDLKADVSVENPQGVNFGTWTARARVSTGVYDGVQRHKPVGDFLNPTPYFLQERSTTYQHGTCYHNPWHPFIGAPGQVYRGIVGTPDGMGRFNGQNHFDAALSETALTGDEGSLRNTALIAARLNLKSTRVNLGVAFGERKATASLLGDTATRLATSVRALRRGQTRNAMDALGISARSRNTNGVRRLEREALSLRRQGNALGARNLEREADQMLRANPRGANVPRKWLELQYGWRPLLSDVYGAASALENRPKSDWRVTAKATRSHKMTGYAEGFGFDAYACRARGLASVFTRLDMLPQNEALISLASLGVTNPLSVAWELVPYSFVVDWAIPIGGFLDSLDATLGYSTAAYSSSFFVKADWKDRGRRVGNGYINNNFTGSKRLVLLRREVSTSVPMPSLPSFKDPRSLGHMANGLALLATAFGRR